MVHTFKRIYLYTAVTFALLFTAGAAINMLYLLLEAAGLLPYDPFSAENGFTPPPPSGQQIAEGVVFFAVAAVLIGALFGGSHYWLIRRDARSDPQADAGPTRQVFLNGLLALSALVAVPTGLQALAEIAAPAGVSTDIALPLAFALVAGLVFLLVALERERVRRVGRAAGIIRQIQDYAMQGILVLIAASVFSAAVSALLRWALVSSGGVSVSCPLDFSPCPSTPVLGPMLEAVFALAAWGVYVWLGMRSWGVALQRVLWYAAFGYGLIWLLLGVAYAVNTGAGALFGVENAWQESLDEALPFVGLLLTGVLIALPYLLWMRRLAAQEPARQEAIQQGQLAILTGLSALFFLGGAWGALGGVVEQVVPNGSPLGASGWATVVAALVAGLGYLPLWLLLRQRSDPAQPGPILPRRAYVFSLLIVSAVPALIAVVLLVFQLVAISLSLEVASPLTARLSAVAVLVLGAAALYHLWQLLGDLRQSRARVAATQPALAMATVSVGAPLAQAARVTTAPSSGPANTTTAGAPETLAAIAGPSDSEAETLADVAGAAGGPETLESILQAVAAGALEPATAAARIRHLPGLGER